MKSPKLTQLEGHCIEEQIIVFNFFPFLAQILNWNDVESIDLKKKKKEFKGFAPFKKICVFTLKY